MRLAVAAALFATAATGSTAAPGTRTYANPIDLDYRYNWEQVSQGISYRTGADPAVVRHKGAYYMVQTLADGYWRSTDLINWTFIKPSMWPMRSVVAPAVLSDGERLYIMPSRMEGGVILVSDAPETGKLDYLTRRSPELPNAIRSGQEDYIKPGQIAPGPWDPQLFKDDDGRWYLYWGSSNVFPLYGIELDPKNRLSYIGKATEPFRLHPERHGWERFGEDHSGGLPDGTKIAPFMEGAWMTKVDGRYYLQYGAPGTEYNAYANGAYVGASPLGPFTYPNWNPVAYKPGGFVEGAGHGSTFADAHGNWWNTGTPWLGYNWTFERRIAMFPTKFEADGQMWSSTRFGDFPHWMPEGKVDDPTSLFTGWMLLSYKKPVVASSTLPGFPAERITDENPRTFWVAAANKPGETLTLDLGATKTVRALQVNFADYKSGRFADAPDIYTEFRLEASADGKTWRKIAGTEAPRRDRPNAYFQLDQPERARFIRYVHGHVGAANLAVADIRVFGNAGGKPPASPTSITATREQDQRNARITWQAVKGATGYNVRWGVKPDRLTFTYQVFADDGVKKGVGGQDIRSLNIGQDYWATVEAFNESGVSPIGAVKPIR
ncbi:family 43 glycosylhydrolase [Sphingomonas jeddahensis]|uniref:Glycosyl hydrolases family 43 n=1 Tax=Sphingomonas jeddahensis TaxID=1915074 RepID=A0A1V2ERY5_9SPHN|nr:family 43 glycosylhydrolase [Sphingomonas jeddahensis]ONF95436.1 Glycosyl hydrolases family 43 [Sphingomonas jeddahensis]